MKQPEIDAIKARLKATPGLPWALDEVFNQIYSPGTGDYIGTEGDATDPEVAFILHAPTDIADLLRYVEQLEAREVALLAEFAAGIQPVDTASPLPYPGPAFGDFLRGANSVHATNLRWVRWKAVELGLPWPLPEAEFLFRATNEAGQLVEPLTHQVPGMPQAQCHGCGLPSHAARCQAAGCPVKPQLQEGGEGQGLSSCQSDRDGDCKRLPAITR